MNKMEFVNKLEKKLRYLPVEDREDAIAYYKEYIEEMGADDVTDISAKLGSPSEVAAGILAECTQKKLKENEEGKKAANSTQIVWLIILAVCSIPVLIPLAIVLVIVLLAVLLVAFCMAFASVLSVVAMPYVMGIGQKLICLGTGCIFLALGILLVILCIELARTFILLIIKLIKKLGRKEKES